MIVVQCGSGGLGFALRGVFFFLFGHFANRCAAMVDKHLFVIILAAFGGIPGGLVFFRVGGGVQRHQRGHLGGFLAAVGFGAGLFFVLVVPVGAARLGAGDLEGFNIVFLAAAGICFLLGEQGLTVRDRDLVVVGVDFRESQEALAIAAIFDEGSLERRLHTRHFREINVSLERPLGGGLEIKFLDLRTVENDHPCFFRVVGIDKHALGH